MYVQHNELQQHRISVLYTCPCAPDPILFCINTPCSVAESILSVLSLPLPFSRCLLARVNCHSRFLIRAGKGQSLRGGEEFHG